MMFEIEKVERAVKEIEENLFAKIKLSNFKMIEICKRHEIGSIGGEVDSHLAHEALEVAVNNFVSKNYCQNRLLESSENSRILAELEELEKRIPVQSWRSMEQLQF